MHILFEQLDAKNSGKVSNEEFMSVLMQSSVYLSKIDLSNILKAYKVNDLDTNYGKFLNDLSPKLGAEREKAVKQLFDLIRAQKEQNDNFIFYHDLMSLCDFKQHPSVQSGQFSANYAREIMESAFDSIQDEEDKVSYDDFLAYFCGISSAYPYNTDAFIRFIQSCWHSLFKIVNDGNLSVDEENKYIEQIEAMLAEKTRQKVKGSESENNTLLRQCKHFDIANKNFLNFEQFVQTLESFGVMAPAKDLATLFGKWCVEEKSIKKLKYREFVNELFKKY